MEYKIGDTNGSNLEKLEEQYKKMWETIAQLRKEKEEIIYVPDCIKIVSPVRNLNLLWIINDEWYMLRYLKSEDSYRIQNANIKQATKCKLIKTTWWELSPWDICYDYDRLDYIDDLFEYWLKLKDWSMQYWAWKDCVNNDWYKDSDIVYKVVLAN